MPIEVDENGTLDLSMKKCKENVKSQTKAPSNEQLSPPESTMAKGGSILISPAFYQPLCDRDSWESPIPVNFSKAHVLQDKEVNKHKPSFKWDCKTHSCVNNTMWYLAMSEQFRSLKSFKSLPTHSVLRCMSTCQVKWFLNVKVYLFPAQKPHFIYWLCLLTFILKNVISLKSLWTVRSTQTQMSSVVVTG